ncbi:hypothetical protein Tco_0251319 [Tanacetum coccineum]
MPRAPTEGITRMLIVFLKSPRITLDQTGLLNLCPNKEIFGNDKEDHHAPHPVYDSTNHFYDEIPTMHQLIPSIIPNSNDQDSLNSATVIIDLAVPSTRKVNQPVAHQGPAPQTHGVSKTDFERYVTANDAVLRNMQNQGITTRSGVTIQGPKAVNHNAEVTKDTMPPANNGSTEDVQPPVVQIQSRNPNPEPNVAPVVTPVPKASIPFPSRRNDEKRKEKANDQNEKFYEIFRDLSFEISFTDALMLMPKLCFTL